MSDLKSETGSKGFRFGIFTSRFGVSTIPRHVKFEGEITQNRSDSESVSERTEIEYQTSDTRGKFRDSLLDGGDRPGTDIQWEIASIYHMGIG